MEAPSNRENLGELSLPLNVSVKTGGLINTPIHGGVTVGRSEGEPFQRFPARFRTPLDQNR